MVLDMVLRLSWIGLLLCSTAYGYPFKKVPTGTGGGDYYGDYYYGGGSGSGSGGAGGSVSGGLGSGSVSGGAGADGSGNGFPIFGGFPWDSNFVVVPQFFNPDLVKLPRFFFGNPFDVNGVPLGSVDLPPPPPASHIVQTSNGYQRAKSVLAHSKYSPHDFAVLPVSPGSDHDGSQVKDWHNKKVYY